jgi:lipid-A-disaccharide synthase
MSPKILIVAGEPSGDQQAAQVVQALRLQHPAVEFIGTGGDALAAARVKLYFHIKQLSFMGFIEVIGHLAFMRRVMRTLLNAVEREKPDLVILVDYPGFNLWLARRIKEKHQVPILYYITPQLWAWGSGRIQLMRKYIDHLVVILPFEKAFYAQHGITAEYFGHPLIEAARPAMTKESFFQKFGIQPRSHVLGLLPGSRLQEVCKILPVMLRTAERVHRREKIQVVVGASPNINPAVFTQLTARAQVPCSICPSLPYDVMRYADLVLTASGTATLETAYIGTPLLILYKVSFATWLAGRLLVKIPYIGLVNVVLGKKAVPEFIPFNMRPSRIAPEVLRLLGDTAAYQQMVQELARVRELLGTGSPSQQTARHIARLLSLT